MVKRALLACFLGEILDMLLGLSPSIIALPLGYSPVIILDLETHLHYNTGMSNETTAPSTFTTKNINRRDLVQMSELSDDLDEHDIVFVQNRGVLDAVMMRPGKMLSILDGNGGSQALACTIHDRVKQDELLTLTDRDISILRAVGQLGNGRLVDIAGAVQRESSNIHRALQNLVDQEMVDRSTGSEITYNLTGLGRRTIEDA